MLIELYKKEDRKFGVNYINGVLKNLEYPLNPKLAKEPANSLIANSSYGYLSSSIFVLFLC